MASIHSGKGSHNDEKKIEEKGYDTGSPQGEKEARKDVLDLDTDQRHKLNAIFENPLAGIPKATLLNNVEEFCQQNDLMDVCDSMKKGALAAQTPWDIHNIPELSPEDVSVLEREKTHKWDQPWQLYWLVCK